MLVSTNESKEKIKKYGVLTETVEWNQRFN